MQGMGLLGAVVVAMTGCAVTAADDEADDAEKLHVEHRLAMPPSAFHEYLGQLVAPVTMEYGNHLESAVVAVRCLDIKTEVYVCARETDEFDSSLAAFWCAGTGGAKTCGDETRAYDIPLPKEFPDYPDPMFELIIMSPDVHSVQCRGATLTISE